MDQFDLLKSHIDAYTRKDGVVVGAYDNQRPVSLHTVSGMVAHYDSEQHVVDHHHATSGGGKNRYHIADGENGRELRDKGQQDRLVGVVRPRDDYGHGDGGEDVSKPAGVDPYDHAIASGAARQSGVRVYADAWAAHRAAARDTKAAVVMKHPAHDKHVVVNLADGAKMEKNGYKVVKQK